MPLSTITSDPHAAQVFFDWRRKPLTRFDALDAALPRADQPDGMRMAKALSPQRWLLALSALIFVGVTGVAHADSFLPLLGATLRMAGNLLGGLDPASLDFFVAGLPRTLV